MPGKVIGRRTYLHVETPAALDDARYEAWEQTVTQAEQSAGLDGGEQFNGLRLRRLQTIPKLDDPCGWFVTMLPGPSGRLLPRTLTIEAFLKA